MSQSSINKGFKICSKEIEGGFSTIFKTLSTQQSLYSQNSMKSSSIFNEEYIIPQDGIPLEKVVEDTITQYGNSLNHTFKYNIRGLGDKPNIDEACVLGDIIDKTFSNPAFSWDCSAAHADSMVILAEK